MAKKLVIVESPAKAKTINKYLGNDFKVIASFGHVRDLPSKNGSVDPNADFAMNWEVSLKSKKHLQEIIKEVKDVDIIYLAMDPDREGEAIAWHVSDILAEKKLLKNVDLKRITFNEITKKAVLEAVSHPRNLDTQLINAYLARRALDYLVGFNLSPVLWRKLPGSRSAGRVQSVALRLICNRESEIEQFKTQEYWSIFVDLITPRNDKITGKLTHVLGQKLEKFSIPNETKATEIANRLRNEAFTVSKIEKKQVKRYPSAPFTTSTLQQEASRKLGYGATRTMRIAQKLYEGVTFKGESVGLITYMRTDGVQISNDAIASCRTLIEKDFGKTYVPNAPRVYKAKAKNAQEAHEAIRPTDIMRHPSELAKVLEPDELKLYDLIWKRTLASQMESATLDQVSIDFESTQKDVARATGSTIAFDGFLRLYHEGQDDSTEAGADANPDTDPDNENQSDRLLPPVFEKESVQNKDVRTTQHFTQPPPRYTEASLVKKLEELGIGRPSTYASIMQVLQDRNYVILEKKRFIPEGRGRLVTVFLESFFTKYVEYGFTAALEEQLDDISDGKANWKKVLEDFWTQFSGAIKETDTLRISDVLDKVNEDLDSLFFPPKADGSDPHLCPSCQKGRLSIKLGKFGSFAGCSNYPECNYTKELISATEDQSGAGGEENQDELNYPVTLGNDPETDLQITLRKGPYGVYIQLGDTVVIPAEPANTDEAPKKGKGKEKAADKPKAKTKAKKEKTIKPKRAPIPRGYKPQDITLDLALKFLALPRHIGTNPETGLAIVAGIGRFGPYLKHGEKFTSLPKDDNVLEIGLNRAITVLAEKEQASPGSTQAQVLMQHPKDGKDITTASGRYGPYIKHGKTLASLPKGKNAEDLTVDEVVALLDAKTQKKGK